MRLAARLGLAAARCGSRTRRRSANEYVNGLAAITNLIQPCAPEAGNNAPESIQSGTSSRFMTAWNPWELSMRQAIKKPSSVKVIEIKKIAPVDSNS